MAKRLELETLADVYTQCTTLVPGTQQRGMYRFQSGEGHISYDSQHLEYDGDACKISIRPDIEQGVECFRVEYSIYPAIVSDAIDSSLGKNENKKLDQILKDLVPRVPLRKEIVARGFDRSEDDGAECTITTYNAKNVYQLIEHYIKKDPLYIEEDKQKENGDKKTFIKQRKQRAKHERGKRRPASDAQYARDNHRGESEQPAAEPAGSDSEPPGIAV